MLRRIRLFTLLLKASPKEKGKLGLSASLPLSVTLRHQRLHKNLPPCQIVALGRGRRGKTAAPKAQTGLCLLLAFREEVPTTLLRVMLRKLPSSQPGSPYT